MQTKLSPELIIILVSVVTIVFLSGIILGYNNAQKQIVNQQMHTAQITPMHMHEKRMVSEPYPTLSFEVIPDVKMGWNVHIETTNFVFAPQNVNTDYVEGEGHAHLYVNGVRLTRLYGNWYYLKELLPGENEITVSLSGNDHSELYAGEDPIRVTKTLIVE